MIVVLDASAAIRCTEDPNWTTMVDDASLVLAPALFPSEVANAYWRYVRAKHISFELAEDRLRAALALVDDFRAADELAVEAFDLAVKLNRAVYDCFYLVLARRTGANLLTADKGLRAAAESIGVRVG